MIENFLDFIDKYGFVPNAARIYYLNRSQSSLLAMMIKIYIEYTNDIEFLHHSLSLLEKELQFWAINNTLEVTSSWSKNKYNLSRYVVLNNQPRPESYREDYIIVNNEIYFNLNDLQYSISKLNDSSKANLYAKLISDAESGMNYST